MKQFILLILIIVLRFGYAQEKSNVKTIKSHLIELTKAETYRNHSNIDRLNEVANYLKIQFKKSSDSVVFQKYDVKGKTYKNVICSFGTEHKKRIIIGAHYDVCGNQEGADDNASGVVGLLELSRLLKEKKLKHRIDLVAYTLEEPPYFRTEYMGSYVHALSLLDTNCDVYGMVSLEMIGYFSDQENSQLYPDPRLKQMYGSKGDFITLVNKSDKKKFAIDFGNAFKKTTNIKTIIFDSEPLKQPIDFSDHLNYWNFGYSALMITDTAFLRNKNYHKKTDTLETLNLKSMSEVIDAVFKTIIIL